MPIRYEIRHLRHFIAVAEELNFSLAADRLSLAQPALSRSIKQLEDQLELQLLVRSSRQVTITDEGKLFLQGAYQVLELLEETHRKVQIAARGEAGYLRIGYTNFAIIGTLPTILNAFRVAYPAIKLDIVHKFTSQQIEDIKNKKLDFAFVTGPIQEESLDSMTVQRDKLVAIVSNQHPLATRASVGLKELANEPFVMGFVKGWNYFYLHVQTICMRRGFLPKIVQEAYDSESIFGFIEANMGITLHIECARNYYRKGVTVLDIDDVEERILTDIIWLRGQETPAQRKFIDFVREYLNAPPLNSQS